MAKYEELLERSIRTQEEASNVSKSLLKVAENLQGNMAKINDNFVLHSQGQGKIASDVKIMKDDMMKWIKRLAIALFFAVGGATVFKLLMDLNIFK